MIYSHAAHFDSLEEAVHIALDYNGNAIEAAKAFCNENGLVFTEMTERDLCDACMSYGRHCSER